MNRFAERRQIRRDVAARRLHVAAHRDAEPVVLDVEEHRQRERRRHRERRPEAVRRDRRLAAEHDADRAVPRSRRRARRGGTESACAQPAAGVYCEPTSPDIGSTIGPLRFGRLQTTPMSRPSLNPPARPSGLRERVLERRARATSSSGRER